MISQIPPNQSSQIADVPKLPSLLISSASTQRLLPLSNSFTASRRKDLPMDDSDESINARLESLIPTESNIPALQAKILHMLRQRRAGRFCDIEGLCQQILFKAWQNKTPITYRHILSRMINAYHRERVRRNAIEVVKTHSIEPLDPSDDQISQATIDLISQAHLSSDEKSILYYIYFGNCTLDQVASLMNRPKSWIIQTHLGVLNRMRQIGRSEGDKI